MRGISRRRLLGGAVATTAAMTLGAPTVHAQKGRRTLRFVAQADLKVVDPVWTTAYITRNHAYLVYDTLFGTDEQLQIKPQMVEQFTVSTDGMKYTFTLRDGLRWHDGQPVRAEDCVESLKRWGKKDRFGQLLMAHTGRIAPVDQKTFRLELAERFGPVLDALGKPSTLVPFIMPARIATTSPDEQLTEIVGSGPFKFVRDEWQPGNQVVYVRNPDYVPRHETPSGSIGGKQTHLDKVIWRYMPDPADAADALAAGDVDWCYLRCVRHQELTEAIPLPPALQRLHAVFRQNWLSVVPPEALAQRERVLHAVGRDGHPIDHLRLDPKLLVSTEKGVVHEIAVVTRYVSGRPNWIEDL